jgi:paraquat-inducible protein B
MGKRVSPTVIGAFVVASFAILVVALVVVGSGKMFTKPIRFICMFPGDLNGLKIGAPVKVRGVQVGEVEAIRLRLDPSEGQPRPDFKGFRLPVIIDLDKSMLRQRGATGALDERGVEDWIKRGMRAQLQVESLLTGLLYIDLDLHKGTQPNFILQLGGPYQEIPTVPTDLAQLQQHLMETLDRFEKIDFKGLVNSITDAANSIKSLANSPDLKETLESLKVTVASLNQTIVAARQVLNNANAQIGPLVTDLRESAAAANKTMEETRATLVRLQQGLDPNSPLIVHLNQSLESLDQTSRSVGELTDYLQRNPAALIRGRYGSDNSK